MQARGLVNYYRLKYCWPKVIYCIYQPTKKTEGAKQEANQKSGGAMAYPGPLLESPLLTWGIFFV